MSHPVIYHGRQVGFAECELRGGFVVINNIILTEVPQDHSDYFEYEIEEVLIDCE